MNEVKLARRNGILAWETRLDGDRSGQCLCMHCKEYSPGVESSCPTAKAMFDIAFSTGVRFIMTRCPKWQAI